MLASPCFSLVTRPKPPLGQIVIETLHHATCDVNSPKAVETLKCMEKVTDIAIFIAYKVYFLLVLSKLSTRS